MSAAHNLLVVDFDFFFDNVLEAGVYTGTNNRAPLLYDWSHKETPMYQEWLWPGRASAFVANGLELPGLTGEQSGFWERFTSHIHPRAKLFYADSNAMAISRRIVGPRTQFGQVWLYDAHHDAGYGRQEQRLRLAEIIREGKWSCDYWMVLYWAIGAQLHMRYPRWRTRAFEIEPEPIVDVDRAFDDGSSPAGVSFDRIFICRSSAWVPPWQNIDQQFLDFVTQAPVPESRRFALQPCEPRAFSMQQVQDELEHWRRVEQSRQQETTA